MQKDKIESLVGFAVKAGKIVYGADGISRAKKNLYLTLVCNSISQKSLKYVLRECKRRKLAVIKTEKPLEDVVYKKNCKVITVSDKQMSEAILKEVNENYQLLLNLGGDDIDN